MGESPPDICQIKSSGVEGDKTWLSDKPDNTSSYAFNEW